MNFYGKLIISKQFIRAIYKIIYIYYISKKICYLYNTNKMKFYLVILFTFISSILCFSQQDSQYTQYMYNTTLINPAYAGSREVLSAFILHRNQWMGLEGAPVTNNFSINSPIGDSNFGIGLNFMNDKLDPFRKMKFQLT